MWPEMEGDMGRGVSGLQTKKLAGRREQCEGPEDGGHGDWRVVSLGGLLATSCLSLCSCLGLQSSTWYRVACQTSLAVVTTLICSLTT